MSIEAKDLAEIIKACKRADVAELKIGDVSIKFKTGEAVKTPESKPENLAPIAKEIERETEKSLLQENFDSAQEHLANLQLENPALYEELLIERELELGDKTYN